MKQITIKTQINAPIDKVWDSYTNPSKIVKWNFASPTWCCPKAENNLIKGGKFKSRMEARDGSSGFDFEGTYDDVIPKQKLEYTFGDRHATVLFEEVKGKTNLTISFDPENENPESKQKEGWQAILDNFKKFVEN